MSLSGLHEILALAQALGPNLPKNPLTFVTERQKMTSWSN
jgi:hypothetical protein